MNRFFSIPLGTLLLTVAQVLAAGHEQALWIVSGQSNACGRAKLIEFAADPRVKMFDPENSRFVVAQDPLPGMNTKGMGPWVVAGHHLAKNGTSVQLVGYAMGGRPIAFWHPGQPGDEGLFPRIARAGRKAGVFLWYQGESDAHAGMSTPEYQRELQQLVARVRKAAKNREMLVVIVQLGPCTTPGVAGYTSIREAQRRFVASDPRAVLMPALGRTLGDTVHMDSAANLELGAEIARALFKVQYRREDVNWPGPVLDAAAADGKNRKRVVAHFAEVRQLQGAEASDFAILDPEGSVRCMRLTAGATLVTLDFERDFVEPAKLVYGYGTNPKATLMDEAGNRAPAVQIRIAKGASPEDIPTTVARGAGAAE
jgi:hypothetical protein